MCFSPSKHLNLTILLYTALVTLFEHGLGRNVFLCILPKGHIHPSETCCIYTQTAPCLSACIAVLSITMLVKMSLRWCGQDEVTVCCLSSENEVILILKPIRQNSDISSLQIGKHPRTRIKQIDQHPHSSNKSQTPTVPCEDAERTNTHTHTRTDTLTEESNKSKIV